MRTFLVRRTTLAAVALAAALSGASGTMASVITGTEVTAIRTSPTPPLYTVNLTAQGSVDWIHYSQVGDTSVPPVLETMSGGSGISTPAVSSPINSGGHFGVDFTWTNGTPSTTGDDTGFVGSSGGTSITFNVTADGQAEVLSVSSAGYNTTPNTTINLTDTYTLAGAAGSPVSFSNTVNYEDFLIATDTIDFTAPVGTTLSVSISTTSGAYGTYFAAATLANVPEPASLGILAVGGLGMLLFKRRRLA